MAISTAELNGLTIASRVSSSISLLGILFTLITFTIFPQFNKPITRLVYYATWTNLVGVIAPLMGQAGIDAGEDSALCQFQGFIVNFYNMDVYWTLCIAINVYLVFFRRYTTDMLKELELRYMIACNTPQILISFLYIFIRTEARGRIYGNATTWCWVKPEWGVLRITTVYGPVWVACVIIAMIYIAVGIKIVRERRRILSFAPEVRNGPVQPNSIRKEVSVGVFSEVGVGPLPSPGLSFDDAAAYTATAHGRPTAADCDVQPAGMAHDAVAMAYARFACLFFLSMLCTWIAPSVNRIYALFEPEKPVFALNLATSILLPLQGFWNFIVYVAASMPACKSLWSDIKSRGSRSWIK